MPTTLTAIVVARAYEVVRTGFQFVAICLSCSRMATTPDYYIETVGTGMRPFPWRKMAEANIRPELIAEGLNRSVHAIKARAYAIGLPLKWFKLKAKAK